MLFICSLFIKDEHIYSLLFQSLFALEFCKWTKQKCRIRFFRSSLIIFNLEKVEIHFYYLHCLFNFTFHLREHGGEKKKCVTNMLTQRQIESQGSSSSRVMFRWFVHSFLLSFFLSFLLAFFMFHFQFFFLLFMARNNWVLWRLRKEKKQFVPVGAHENEPAPSIYTSKCSFEFVCMP